MYEGEGRERQNSRRNDDSTSVEWPNIEWTTDGLFFLRLSRAAISYGRLPCTY